jgi:hypothetical protein
VLNLFKSLLLGGDRLLSLQVVLILELDILAYDRPKPKIHGEPSHSVSPVVND